MAYSEFNLIDEFFADLGVGRDDVILGIGDDCALLDVAEGRLLAVSMDTLVRGVHFFADVDPESLGHKALAVGLSDLAAMGATPAWATLALTLPGIDRPWLRRFATGFGRLAARFGVQLVGGDTTRGPMSISVQVHGLVASDGALRRGGAGVGDDIYVSGTLGDAGLVVRARQGDWPGDAAMLNDRLDRPEPRLALGQALSGIATAAIDISDGLSSDLGHILRASGVGAAIDLSAIPRSSTVAAVGDWALPLASGDDYELCFSVPPAHAEALMKRLDRVDVEVTRIGVIEPTPGIRWRLANGDLLDVGKGWEHFS